MVYKFIRCIDTGRQKSSYDYKLHIKTYGQVFDRDLIRCNKIDRNHVQFVFVSEVYTLSREEMYALAKETGQ